MDKKQTWNAAYWLLAALLLVWVQGLWQGAQRIEPVPYSEFDEPALTALQAQLRLA